MCIKNIRISLVVLFLLTGYGILSGQESVPFGINYQAVARDNYGKELANTSISIRFSIISGDLDGSVIYQEIHQNIITSKYGVFSLVIGHGVPTTAALYNSLSAVQWDQAAHYLKVEVKFGNDFLDMGTMQFLAVPYALFAQKSLEPGPQGPKGDPGDPASDDQTLSFNGSNLSISGGNTVNLSTLSLPHQLSLMGDTLSILGGNKVVLLNRTQDLQLDNSNILKISNNVNATPIDMSRFLDDKQQLTFNSVNNTLTITGGNTIDLMSLKNDADYDPANEIQDLNLSNDKLTITNKTDPTEINLAAYLDDTDNQTLSYDPATYALTISKSVSNVTLGSMIAFRAKKTVLESGLPSTDHDFVTPEFYYNDGLGFNFKTGVFTSPISGIYTFVIGFNASSVDNMKALKLLLNGTVYETLISDITRSSSQTRSITMKLNTGDEVKLTINPGLSGESGTGSFSGFRVY